MNRQHTCVCVCVCVLCIAMKENGTKGSETIWECGHVGLAVVLLEEDATVEVVSKSHIY